MFMTTGKSPVSRADQAYTLAQLFLDLKSLKKRVFGIEAPTMAAGALSAHEQHRRDKIKLSGTIGPSASYGAEVPEPLRPFRFKVPAPAPSQDLLHIGDFHRDL